MLKMKNSGYRQKFRKEILDSGQKAFQKMIKDDKAGVKSMYRSGEYNEKQESEEKKFKFQIFSYWGCNLKI